MTPWRKMLYRKLKTLSLEGKVLDLGGVNNANYHRLFSGTHTITTANLGTAGDHDLSFDFEDLFPVGDGEYETALAINVIEHLFDYRRFLQEVRRILTPSGKAIIAVPFLVQVHPSPHDHFRYTEETLERLGKDAGFARVSVTAIGAGPFTAAAQIIFNALKFRILQSLSVSIAGTLDRLISMIDRKKNFTVDKYPLGYVVVLEKIVNT